MLEEHFKTCSKRSSYRSKTTQNDLISCCGTFIVDTIVKEANHSGFFSILADGATDCSNKEQMPIVFLRYVDEASDIKKRFVKFVYCQDGITGDAISTYLKTELRSLGLDLSAVARLTMERVTWWGDTSVPTNYVRMSTPKLSIYIVHAIYIHCACESSFARLYR